MLEKNKKLLLHACCAPCACSIIQLLKENDIDFSVFFYNPNIFPSKEYETRKEELIRYCQQEKVPLIIAEGEKYKQEWEETVKGLEKEPERGKRCSRCFDHRLEKTFRYAVKNDFDLVETTLSISSHKDSYTINNCGKEVAKTFLNVEYCNIDWKQENLKEKAIEIIRKENFYTQKYCGCFYSIGDKVQ